MNEKSMTHPNEKLLRSFDLANLEKMAEVLADDFVWHYFNPKLPHLQGDYLGVEGLQDFFSKLGTEVHGTFTTKPVSVHPVGDELLAVQVKNTMRIEGETIAVDALVVWRIVEGKIAEAWDIPAIDHLASA